MFIILVSSLSSNITEFHFTAKCHGENTKIGILILVKDEHRLESGLCVNVGMTV
jgi:hypothetical protein